MALPTLANALGIYFNDYVIRYFTENSSLSRADALLNKYPREISIHLWHYPLRASVALIAAKLSANPKYAELAEIYSEEMKEAVEPYKKDFENIKDLLSVNKTW